MNLVRSERAALEDVIGSLRKENETLRISLSREFDTNDAFKAQINRLNKEHKELEAVSIRQSFLINKFKSILMNFDTKNKSKSKLVLLQSLYKRILPVLISNKSQVKNLKLANEPKDEAILEDFVDNAIAEMVEQNHALNEKLCASDKELVLKEDTLQQLQKKCEEQATKFSKVLKEKESHYSRQKDSLVAYYEKMVNEANSRIKVQNHFFLS